MDTRKILSALIMETNGNKKIFTVLVLLFKGSQKNLNSFEDIKNLLFKFANFVKIGSGLLSHMDKL